MSLYLTSELTNLPLGLPANELWLGHCKVWALPEVTQVWAPTIVGRAAATVIHGLAISY
jgi:hypothetical protein